MEHPACFLGFSANSTPLGLFSARTRSGRKIFAPRNRMAAKYALMVTNYRVYWIKITLPKHPLPVSTAHRSVHHPTRNLAAKTCLTARQACLPDRQARRPNPHHLSAVPSPANRLKALPRLLKPLRPNLRQRLRRGKQAYLRKRLFLTAVPVFNQ